MKRYEDQSEAEGVSVADVNYFVDVAAAWSAVDEIANDPHASAADIAQVVYEQQETLAALARH